ncbi:MAG: ankyrin repeat domain-containing protein [Gammaproteobacteria bacterium]|nr:ankyrin repeat domain-containing protein [Gammaproteobacteria bacterium]
MSRMPKYYVLAGLPLAALSAILAGRLIWEETVVTRELGPQQVALSILQSGLGSVLYVALYGGLLWLAVYLVAALAYRTPGGRTGVVVVLVYLAAWGVVRTPYGYWLRHDAAIHARGAHAAEFALYAAATGDAATLAALLDHGVALDARTKDGATPLHAAAAAGEMKAVELLVARGANVNAANVNGDPPIAHAAAAKHDAVVRYLAAHGAKPAEPSAELRAKAGGGPPHRAASPH